MSNQHDADRLLQLMHDRTDDAYDPESPHAQAAIERILSASPLRQTRHSVRARRAALIAVPVTLAAGALVATTTLEDSPTGLAQAAVLSRAEAALQQPGTITYLQVDHYSARSVVVCMLGGRSKSMCITGPETDAASSVSANPAEDVLTYSDRQWLSADGTQEHTIYNNGDETTRNTDSHKYKAYDPTDNTLTTLTESEDTNTPPPSSHTPSPLPTIQEIATPAYYEDLYRQAQTHAQNVKLLGLTTLAGRHVYELRFQITPKPPANPPAGDTCGHTACTPPSRAILLYLDSHTFTPIRTVQLTENTNDLPGIPNGTSVASVTDFTMESLPDTPANDARLHMSPHPGATPLKTTGAQNRAAIKRSLTAGSPRTAGRRQKAHAMPAHTR